MFRRDEFIDLLGEHNSDESLQRQLKDLEKTIDDELRNVNNIIKMINSTTATTQSLENGLEIVETVKTTTIVHRDITVVSDTKYTAGSNSDAVSYALWSDSLKYPNSNNASSLPWIDKTIAETSVISFNFDGVIRIKCPENTNKFVAKLLADKYMSVGKTDKKGTLISGFWSQSNRANNKNNGFNIGNKILNDAIRVLYDKSNNIVYLEFKLF